MLNLWPRKLSDDEFVERIRRQLPSSRKVAAIMSLVYGLMLVGFLCYVPSAFESLRKIAPNAAAYDHGFGIGLVVGAAIGSLVVMLAWHFIHSLLISFGPQFFRLHQLLLKYHDLAAGPPTRSKNDDV